MSKVRKITHPHAWQLLQARIDESIVTGQPLVERPFWYENTENGQIYYDLFGCIGWPTEVSDKDPGMPGYAAVVAIIKPKDEGKPVADAAFRLMGEGESPDIPTLLDHVLRLREEWGFGIHQGFLQTFLGDPERYVTTLALLNERLIAKGGEHQAILVSPSNDFYEPKAFDNYVRSLRSTLVPGKIRFYFGGHEILKNHLREFRRDCPAVMAVGGLVHTLLGQTLWMDQSRESAFVVEEGNNV